MASSSDMGTFSILPREIRDRIYRSLLTLNDLKLVPDPEDYTCFNLDGTNKPKIPPPLCTSILRTCRDICDEAITVLYQCNEFSIFVYPDHRGGNTREWSFFPPGFFLFPVDDENHGKWMSGWNYMFGLRVSHKLPYNIRYIFLCNEMMRYFRKINLEIGILDGIVEDDIVLQEGQILFGPEEWYRDSLLDIINEICGVIKSCDQIHRLRVSMRSCEQKPHSVEKILDPIFNLWNIKNTEVRVFAMPHAYGDPGYWSLGASYSRYMSRTMTLPEGAAAPRYVGDENEPEQADGKIFDRFEAIRTGPPVNRRIDFDSLDEGFRGEFSDGGEDISEDEH